MIELLQYVSNTNGTLTLNDAARPLSKASWPVTMRGERESKMQESGTWPTYQYGDIRTWTFEGAILGTGANDTARVADAVSKLNDMSKKVHPPSGFITARKHGTIRIKLTGHTETYYYSDVVLDSFDPDIGAFHSSIIPFRVVFVSFDPFVYAQSDNSEFML